MAWILTITRHLCMSKLQLRKREPQIYLQDWKEYIEDRSCINQDDKILISYCMESLPDEERQILILHCVSGMSFREIAQFLKLPISTVLSKYHRTIKKLRNRIGEEV
jgi:RNA polymerase sigma-70 factor (ECF subfamily)